MRVTFVYPDYFETLGIEPESQGRVYLGLGYLSSCVKSAGHEVSLVHLVEPCAREELVARIAATDPDIVAFSSTTVQFRKVSEIARWVKEELDLPTVCGGVHATIAPGDVAADPSIDFVCVGEGEEALPELLGALQSGGSARSVAGIWGGVGGGTFRNPVRPLIEDLDTLPLPDRTLFDPDSLAANEKGRLTMMASRGCPFDCSYCCNHALKDVYPNSSSYVRFRSPGKVVEEALLAIDDDPSVSRVRFDDDILTLKRSWFREFAPLFKKEVGLPFICNARVDLLDEEMVRLLKESGCVLLAMGIESGNAWLRKNVLKRNIDDEKIVRAFELCHEYDIPTVSLNMVGFPHETLKMALDTVKMNALVEPGMAQMTAVYPFPNTGLYRECLEGGMLADTTVDTIFTGTSELNLDGMTNRQVKMVCENVVLLMVAYRRAAGLPRPLGRAAAFALDTMLESGLVPWTWRERLLERGRMRLDWKYFKGVDY